MKVLSVLALVIALPACGGTDPSTDPDAASADAHVTRPLMISSVVDLGRLPLPPTGVGRDGGMSGVLGGRALWSFGDTFLTEHNHIDSSSVLSATSGWSPPADPLAITHGMNGAEPAQLIPYTPEEITANQTDALNGYALWPGPLLDIGEATGVIAYQRIKRTSGSGFESIGVGTARITVDAAAATRTPGLIFAPPEPLFVPHVVLDGFAYAFSCDKRGFLDFACKLGRVPKAQVERRSAYQFFNGSDWTSDITQATYVINQTSVAPSISYSVHLGKYLAVSCKVLSSTVLLRTADRIEGPWGEPTEIEAGTTGVLAPGTSTDWNYLCVEHPELANEDSIVIGYSRPTEPFKGDVRLARITLR
ncbi:hypothetical protein BH11MYX3_BH11MYX3_26980 [soil metagenome]